MTHPTSTTPTCGTCDALNAAIDDAERAYRAGTGTMADRIDAGNAWLAHLKSAHFTHNTVLVDYERVEAR